ncbi:MAG TPA: GNAT family N-acetyltransferase [Balneola sp.]|jgi:predicted N-acetyltransferase YhbS|nr:GNAT family N-acetyltransferase [Balneola sp.]MAO77180.1 GNAT family N-acetyltransferase [Balneola sp.]MBF63371.1 GNAT family N-acetyltransferase [Balneola sp.]HAH52435.1 GNAT family N-acetyltransferase [Balneola sp.]HAW78311.1 GNAT family N-acetyltransferase [Balneola sp.]|tara:strand:- start:16030 stop:16548 length:519 start_codon:yes stop_codon:yes gene_type:complete
MISINIREEKASDYEAVKKVLLDAFETSEEAELVERIRSSKFYVPELSLVAVHKKKIVGHILFSEIEIQSNKTTYKTLALAPVSVAQKFQRNGIGAKLIMSGLEKATDLGFDSVILLGHADYYPRFGFEPTSTWEISPPFDVPVENFMGIELVPKGLHKKSGTVKYPTIWQL